MKRFLPFLVLFALIAPAASNAGEWITREIKWHKASVGGGPGGSTALYVRDTTHAIFGGAGVSTSGVLDTTGTFTLEYAAPVYYGNATTVASGRDSMIAGYLIFQSDSSTVPTGAISSVGLILEGHPGRGNWPSASVAGWTPIDSLTALSVDGDLSITVAIPTRGGQKITTRATQGLSPFSFENLRARAVAGTGALPACRAFVRYWKP